VHETLSDGRICVTLGGDHSIGLGTLLGHLRHDPEVCVLWVDAHPDLNTPERSHSGNGHGMPLGLSLTELQHEGAKAEAAMKGILKPG
jgi:arginase